MAAADGIVSTASGHDASQTPGMERWCDMMEDEDEDEHLEIKQSSASLVSLATTLSCGSASSGSTTPGASLISGSKTPRCPSISANGMPNDEVGRSWHSGGFCLNPHSPVFTPMADLSHGPSMSNFAVQHMGRVGSDQANLMWQLACRALRAEAALPHMEPAGRTAKSVKPQPTTGKSLEQVTLQLRGVSPNLTRECLILDMSEIFVGRYTFIYVPKEFSSGKALGRALICFVSQADAEVAKSYFKENGIFGESVEVALLPPEHHQQWLITRYRNSPVMHPDIPSEYKPVIFANGQRVEFPAPTRAIRKTASSPPS